MKLSKKNIYIGIGLIASISAIVYIIKRKKDNQKIIQQIKDILDQKIKDPNTGGGQKVILKNEYDALPLGQYPIKYGEKNKRVYDIQRMLNKKYGTSIDLDGIYGNSTYDVLCDKVWSSWWSIGDCYELTKTSPTTKNPTGLIRRYIQQKDYDAIK